MIRVLLAATLLATPLLAVGAYDGILAGDWRSDTNKARDQYRHPAATLNFFGLKPNMTVVEISPSGGWYTEVIAPYVRDKGHYLGSGSNPAASANAAAGVARFTAKLAAKPDVYGKAQVTVFAKDKCDAAAPGSADMVLTFRNVHNWHMAGWDQAAFDCMFKALKPGGVLGVEEHRLPEDRPDAQMKTSGYMKVSYVKALAEKAGFKLAGSSEINANPKDTKDYADGVWTLPPTLQKGDVDRAKYLAIGESDRMTLKFVKPK